MTSSSCQNCRRNLLDRYFDKCMYCGYRISEGQRLSDAEKEVVKLKRAQQVEEQPKLRKQLTTGRNQYTYSSYGDSGGEGFLGGDGGGDGCGH